MLINNNPIISNIELNQILALENKQGVNFRIQFTKPIQKIDISFIAGLILLHRQYKTTFDISFTNEIGRIFEVRQYLKQYEKIFSKSWVEIFTRFQGISSITESDYIASESFAPIIIINAESIIQFFHQNLLETTGELLNLSQKYIKQKIQGSNEDEKNYLNSSESITNQLKVHSPICTFVFTILYNKIDPFVKIKEKGIKNPIERTEELWAFTLEYVKGLHELAKNIVEHSSTSEGIVTLRAYDGTEQGEEYKEQVLETHVFDFGEKGIIQKLLEDTEKKKNQHPFYEEDLAILNGSFDLKDFIKPTAIKKLNQQLYRDLAHYGLMKFYKLIEKNDGVVISTSTKRNGDREYYPSNHKKALVLGTSYFFQLPFRPELFKTKDLIPLQESLQGSSQMISGISVLMDIKVVKNNFEISNNEENILFDFMPTLKAIRNRADEAILFKSFANIKESKIKYIAINMKYIIMSASSLLRLLAHLSSNYSQSIIFYNLDFEVYNEMLEDNEQFYNAVKDLQSERRIPYWYENCGLLVLSQLKGIDFTFADVLFGTNEKEFVTANRIISHTFPNTLSIVKEAPKNDFFEVPNCLKPFFYQSSLLPFDLLLFNEENKTLFQSNLKILLNTEISKTI